MKEKMKRMKWSVVWLRYITSRNIHHFQDGNTDKDDCEGPYMLYYEL